MFAYQKYVKDIHLLVVHFNLQIILAAVKKSWVLLFCGLSFFSSCLKRDSDNEKPVISAVNSPAEGDTVFSGNELFVDVAVQDNRELSQLRIKIDAASGESLPANATGVYWWDFLSIGDLSSASQNFQKYIIISDSAASGNYVLKLSVADAAGNLSSDVEQAFFIRNSVDTEYPQIQISSPFLASSVSAGDTLQVEAGFSDNSKLVRIEVFVVSADSQFYYDSVDVNEATFQVSSGISTAGYLPGIYTLRLVATDAVNNKKQEERTFTVN